jgi:hypothetical protein
LSLLIFLGLACNCAFAQYSAARVKEIVITGDTMQIDSMAIWPESLVIVRGLDTLQASEYYFNAMNARLFLRFVEANEKVLVSYSTLPWKAGFIFRRKDESLIQENAPTTLRPFAAGTESETSFLDDKGIQKNGSISRGILFGNNQNLSVNSTLNLQLSGKVSDRVSLLASITDDNIPIQPSGSTQQLQDFDQVFIQLSDEKTKLIAGDFQLRRPTGYFLNYFKRAQGIYVQSNQQLSKTKSLTIEASASISKGRFARNVIQGIEGNQGPYRLRGADNELFIIVLSGTEMVYIDGRLLERGMDKDYVIDYNSAEISFTPRQLITKDRRITVEFQYSERRYARPLLQTSVAWKNGNRAAFLNVYSENDARNQPLQQDLSDEDKAILADGGDNFLATFRSGIDSIGYSNSEVRYVLIDSLGFDSVFVFSDDSARAHYRVNFSFVGLGNGDYVESGFSANGRIYRWTAPVFNGTQWVKQGAYAPIILLASPKKTQMVSAGFSLPISKTEKVIWSMEGALSNRDLNTFSSRDASDDLGAALRTKLQWNEFSSVAETNAWMADSTKQKRFSTSAVYEFTHKNFNPIERFREVEFTRNWNLGNVITDAQSQHWATLQSVARNKRWGLAGLSADVLHMPALFDGYRIKALSDIKTQRNFVNQGEASFLLTSGAIQSFFARHKGRTSQDVGKLRIMLMDEYERNVIYALDTVQMSSYEFLDWEASIGNADTVKKTMRVFYRDRIDRKPSQDLLQPVARADQYGMQWIQRWKGDSRLSLQVSNRRLRVINPELFTLSPENTLLARGEYNTRFWKGAIQNTTFYEIGSGLEQVREFIYLEVPAGQGVYVWNDYNGDNVKDLNEFEVAAFAYEANYIRSFVQSNDYVKTYSNQFSESILFQPARIIKASKSFGRFWSRFSTVSTLRIERKTSQESGVDRFNPLLTDLPDSILLAAQGLVRNILYFNKANPVYGMDYTHQILENRNLLTNGFESRVEQLNFFALRWNFIKAVTFVQEVRWGDKQASSDFLNGRNFLIRYNQWQPKLTYQPSPLLKASVLAQYASKRNELGEESALVRKLGAESTWNSPEKGSIRAEINFYAINYVGSTTNSLAFEMLEGLQPGYNYTWQLAWQRNVAENIQLNILYNGRKPQDLKTIHAGSVQVRAVF